MSSLQSSANQVQTITRPIKLILAIVFGVFCMTVGGIIMKVSLSDLWNAHASRQWIPATATLDVARAVRNSGQGSRGYSQEISYHFDVGGACFEGSRLSFNRQSTKTAEESVAMLPSTAPGSEITVYFDAEDPSRNVVYPSVDSMMFIPPLFALVSLIVGATVAAFRYAGSRSRENARMNSSCSPHGALRREHGSPMPESLPLQRCATNGAHSPVRQMQ